MDECIPSNWTVSTDAVLERPRPRPESRKCLGIENRFTATVNPLPRQSTLQPLRPSRPLSKLSPDRQPRTNHMDRKLTDTDTDTDTAFVGLISPDAGIKLYTLYKPRKRLGLEVVTSDTPCSQQRLEAETSSL